VTASDPGRSTAGLQEGIEWAGADTIPVEEVRDVFLAFTRALRARHLYDPANPVYVRFVSGLRDAFRSLWGTLERLDILVQEDRLIWLGEEVYRNEARADSLAFILYRDGIRDISFSPGIEASEIERLLEGLVQVRTQRGEGEELSTLLWDLDLAFLKYTAVDVGMDGMDPGSFDASEPATPDAIAIAAMALRGEVAKEGADDRAREEDQDPAAREGAGELASRGTVRQEDFNPTLYALDDEERRRLREELRREMERDLRTDTITALLDAMEEASTPARRSEILDVLRTLLPSLLSHGELRPAAVLVTEVRRLSEGGNLGESGDEVVVAILEELSAPDGVAELVRVIEDRGEADGLAELLSALRPSALEALVRESETTLSDAVRQVLRGAMTSIGSLNHGAVLRLLRSSDPVVAGGGIRMVGSMRIEEGAGALAELLGTGDTRVRLAAVEAAATLRSPVLAGALQRALRDASREIRVAAAGVLGALAYPPAARELRTIIEARSFRQADVSEKVAFFQAYGRIAGGDAVPYLEATLNGKGFLGRREPSEIRAGAALGLGVIDESAARLALERARSDEDPVVRSAVGRALRGERKAGG